MNAIIAEDEKRARAVMRNLLESMTVPVRVIAEVDNADDAMEVIARLFPDLVFVDIRMEGMSGIEMIRCLKKQSVDTQYVIVSGYSDFQYAKQCIELGVAGYILKPVTYEEVEHIVLKVYAERKGNLLGPRIREQLRMPDLERFKCSGKSALVRQAIHYVNENMAASCRLSEVAHELKVSPEHLSRVFRREMDVTFTEYVKCVKMDYAIKLLGKTDMRIHEIAGKVGYENENYFHNVFKEAVGVTPNQYRKAELAWNNGEEG